MNSQEVLTTVFLSLKIGVIATICNIPLSFFVSFIMVRKQFRGKNILDGLINLPLVMPPVTTGYLLLFILGKHGVLGSIFYRLTGTSIAFTQSAAILASMFVSFPLIVRSLRISIEMMDPKMEKVAMTLGASPIETLFRITIPLILPGIISGFILGFARSLGEFGATITFAGNIMGKTRTIPLGVYSLLQVPGKERDAGVLVIISILISFIALYSSNIITKKYSTWRKDYGT